MTMYGRAPQGPHLAVKVLVGVAVVVVLVAAVVVWRSAGSPPEPTARPAASPSASRPTTPAAAPASSAPAELSTGSWLISLDGGSGGYLTVDGDFATLSSGQRTVFTAVKGLADKACFSFRAPGGKYLRHYDYRLRFDNPDNSDLFPKDATFCRLTDAPAGILRLRSANYPDRVVHSRDKGLYIDKRDGTDAFDADSAFALEPA